jgi:hypothetical protein
MLDYYAYLCKMQKGFQQSSIAFIGLALTPVKDVYQNALILMNQNDY